ncbi:MAG: hypothetical protein IPK72_17600 [Candidatus Eisenbacteria bacterium]|nr:hypothetical protein [Candidatus Eisenbacteria bacterium]
MWSREEVEGSGEILARLLSGGWKRRAMSSKIGFGPYVSRPNRASVDRRSPPSLGEQSALEELKVESLLIREAADGLTLAGLSLRKRTGALAGRAVVVIRRNGR